MRANVDAVDDYVSDVLNHVQLMKEEHPQIPSFAVGHSMVSERFLPNWPWISILRPLPPVYDWLTPGNPAPGRSSQPLANELLFIHVSKKVFAIGVDISPPPSHPGLAS